MRNVAANFDDDFGIEKPARKKAPARSSKTSAKRKKSGSKRFRFDVDMQRVARYAAIGMSATVAIGIMVNALVMQKGRHPAPLFGQSIAVDENAHKPVTPKAPPKVVEEESEKQAPPVSPPPVSRATKHAEAAAPTSDDAIGRLLQGGSLPADRGDQKTVIEAQRALVKLGFALKPTGTFGPQTKKAIERFEKDHHMPVKGELSRRTLKALAAESGVKIER